ncbi:SAM-dependent methyltransferase [Dactylosporangium darangshiense]|uniref:SAM-dependent methyltransferase n=1 Tax=Dactylosporangium darangshiense TaxID=579108 RepID=A0ABP8D7N7_9ACTN
MTRPDWAPDEVDIDVPNAARMYDYSLGGFHNFAVDREMVERIVAMAPDARQIAVANRAFLGRLVRRLVSDGVRQFLDVGSGIPALASTHEVAQQADPGARVVYVDVDPVAVAHGRAILAGNPRAEAVLGDARRPHDILRDTAVTGLIDLAEPVAVLLIAVLHFVPDADDPPGIVRRFRDAVAPGSVIAISHGSPPPRRERDAEAVTGVYQRTSTPLHLRSAAQIAGLLDGLDLLEPGVVPVTGWHPDPQDAETEPRPEVLAAVGRKPATR